MIIAVSPYHLTTREAPAMAALLLAERVVTMLPAPVDQVSRDEAQAAAGSVPAYLAVMKSWTWTAPLWKAGVITAHLDGESAATEMQLVSGQMSSDEHLSPLRRFMHDELVDERAYLSALAADLLKGGPDPGISVPVMAGLDRFATRHQLLVARPQPTSVVQVAEAKLGEGLSTVAAPVLLQADADRIQHAREVLQDVLENLWTAYDNLALAVGQSALGSPGVPVQEVEAVGQAAAAYSKAFAERRADILDDCEADEVRVVEGTVTIAAMRMPSDAVLRSSLAAMTGLSKAPRESRNGAMPTLPAVRDPLQGRCFTTLIIKPLGQGQRRR
jgi:hypothetical protein